MAANHEILEVVKGALLLLGCHGLLGLFIFGLGFLVSMFQGGYAFLMVWIVGGVGFLFWQLLYVLPLVIWLQRRGKVGMVKGVVIMAVLTALVNGACYLSFFAR